METQEIVDMILDVINRFKVKPDQIILINSIHSEVVGKKGVSGEDFRKALKHLADKSILVPEKDNSQMLRYKPV